MVCFMCKIQFGVWGGGRGLDGGTVTKSLMNLD